jgi:cytochrome c biogenesis protein CcmG/thiol:disulfide interchange protein DsbE
MRCAIALVILAFVSSARAEVKAGQPAADFDAATLAGSSLKLSSLRGKVVLVDFWASWCEPCKKELPILGKLAPRLKAKGIEIVTINIDDNKSNAQEFLRAHGLNQLTVVPDSDKSIVGKYEPPKMPSSFVVDKSGVVRVVNAGFDAGDESKIEQQLSSLAAKDK